MPVESLGSFQMKVSSMGKPELSKNRYMTQSWLILLICLQKTSMQSQILCIIISLSEIQNKYLGINYLRS